MKLEREAADQKDSVSIHDSIVTTIGMRIIAGVYPPGSAIGSETEIGQTFNASRTATREALKILEPVQVSMNRL